MAPKDIVNAGPVDPKSASAKGSSPSKFVPTPEAKKKALTFRLIAALLWAVAIGLEAFTIFWLLNHQELNNFMIWLIAAIVVIGVFAVVGSMIWKKSNRLDPASEKDKVRFFVQNQLGAIITMIAFIPMIVLILLNKDLDNKNKTIASVVAGVVLVVAALLSIDWDPMSEEKADAQTQLVIDYTGQNLVFWVEHGKVYHLCAEYPPGTNIPPLARGDQETNKIYQGTVAQAMAEGKSRLSMYGFTECGLTEGQPPFANGTTPEPTEPTDEPT